jgi:hypothetical protein
MDKATLQIPMDQLICGQMRDVLYSILTSIGIPMSNPKRRKYAMELASTGKIWVLG